MGAKKILDRASKALDYHLFPLFCLYNKIKDKKVVLVDFFDTICYRTIHDTEILKEWAKVIPFKYPHLSVSPEDLLRCRIDSERELTSKYEEVPYAEVMGLVYDKLGSFLSDSDKTQFIEYSKSVDIAIELGCQYRNNKVVDLLRRAHDDGKRVYIVSDFYLPKDALEIFVDNFNIADLFDGIYVSSSLNRTKRGGALYDYVLDDIKEAPENVVMIGDNTHSDKNMAESRKITSLQCFPFWHKVGTNISKIGKMSFSSKIAKTQYDWLYRDSNYAEYSILLYHYIIKLNDNAKNDHAKSLSFLSRGGFFLKKLYDSYQYLMVPEKDSIQTDYCYNSRRACRLAIERYKESDGKENYLKDYFAQFVKNDTLYLVDEGWLNHTQQELSQYTGWNTYGYYIGSKQKDHLSFDAKCVRKGLVFDKDENNKYSDYFGIFSGNCSFYEQILTADHGSVDQYSLNEKGEIVYGLKENDKEKYIYETYIADLQRLMHYRFMGLCVWMKSQNIKEKKLATMMLKSLVFANKKRCSFMNDLDRNRYDNQSDGVGDKAKTVKDVRINVLHLLAHPDFYVSIFCKLQRKVYDKKILNIAYYPLAWMFYGYVRLVKFLF